MAESIDRLLQQLNASDTTAKDKALYQVIAQLIRRLKAVEQELANFTGGGSGSGSIITNNYPITFLNSPSKSGGSSRKGLLGIPSGYASLTSNNTFRGQTKFEGQYYSEIFDNGLTGATPDVDWNNGNQQYYELDTNATFTFSNPTDDGRYVLLLLNDGSTVTWPASIEWPGGVAPTPSAAGQYDLFTFMYVSFLSKYVGAYSLDYAL